MIPKFRVWHKKDKKMFSVLSLNFDCEFLTVSTSQSSDGVIQYSLADPAIILMQSIGLKDKEGKEIFEGDIVETSEMKATVMFGDAMFWLEFTDKSCCDCSSYADDMTVIGNIYENKELLK